MGRDDICRTTANRISVCRCKACSSGGLRTHLFKIHDFSDRQKPAFLRAANFRNPFQVRPALGLRVIQLPFYSADIPQSVYMELRQMRNMYTRLRISNCSTATCEMESSVKKFIFFINGRECRSNCVTTYMIVDE